MLQTIANIKSYDWQNPGSKTLLEQNNKTHTHTHTLHITHIRIQYIEYNIYQTNIDIDIILYVCYLFKFDNYINSHLCII